MWTPVPTSIAESTLGSHSRTSRALRRINAKQIVRCGALGAILAAFVVGCENGRTEGKATGSAAALTPASGAVTSAVIAAPTSAPASAAAVGPALVATGPLSFAPVAKRADASVVTINTLTEAPGRGGRRRVAKGLGTGFIVDRQGTVLTNNHVIEGAESIVVRLSDESEIEAKLVGRDARTDIAVLRLQDKDPARVKALAPLELGDSEGSQVGDWVVAIGNPFGLAHTVSAGIISAKGRTREDVPLDPSGYYNFMQTDASINPGNSGGPLLNLNAEVVGINTAIRGGGAQGIGFAIPINMVKQLLPMLVRDGRITRSALGVNIRELRELTREELAELKISTTSGALVEVVRAGSAAAKAKVEAGDVITEFEGQAIDRAPRLQWLASTAGVGKVVSIKVQRAGKDLALKVTLDELPEPEGRPQP
jgi:serine protease Do